MKFRYIGAYPDGAQTLEAYGKIFAPGVEYDLEGVFASKARGNRFFEAVVEDAEVTYDPAPNKMIVTPRIIETPIDIVSEPPAPDPEPEDVHADPVNGDASDAETSTYDRESLIATAEQFGIHIDKRWKSERIAAAIIAHSQSQVHGA